MDALKALGALRRAGALMVAAYDEIKSAAPRLTEPEIAAAEEASRAIPSAGPPVTTIPVAAALLAAAKTAGKAAAPATKDAANPQMDGAIPYHYFYAAADGSGAIRVDDVVPAGTPGTVTLPVTGHTLSLPSPHGTTQAGTPELFFGYCQRVADQATGGQADKYMASVATLLIGGGIGATADRATWPEAADRFFNLRAYMTPAERAAADAAWAGYVIGK